MDRYRLRVVFHPFSLSLLVFLFSSWQKVIGLANCLYLFLAACALRGAIFPAAGEEREKKKKKTGPYSENDPFSLSFSFYSSSSFSLCLFISSWKKKENKRTTDGPSFFLSFSFPYIFFFFCIPLSSALPIYIFFFRLSSSHFPPFLVSFYSSLCIA